MAQVVREANDALIVIEPQGTVRFANPAAENLFRGTAAQIQQMLADLGPRAGETREVSILNSDRTVAAQMRTSPTVWDGQPALLVTLNDISNLKTAVARIQELEARLTESENQSSGTMRLDSLAACLTATAANP